MKKLLVSAIVVLLMSLAANANLILNGTFEDGGNGWSWYNIDGAGGIYSNGNPGLAFVLNDNGQNNDPTLYQTVSGLIVGQAYVLTGDFRAYHTTSGSYLNAFTVLVTQQVAGTVSLDYNLPLPIQTWGIFSFEFTATNTTATIYLIGERYGSDFSTEVDNISLDIPEPATMSLLVIGALALLRRKK